MMRRFKYLSMILALALLVPAATTAVASGKGNAHSKTTTSLCPMGASSATFTDRFGTGTAAFKSHAACATFFARDRGVSHTNVTPTAMFTPAAAMPSTTRTLRLRGNSLAARAVCPVRKNFTLAFTNSSLSVNGQTVTPHGQTISITQLNQSASTVLAGTHTFANHGTCVSFFATNRHLFILTLQQ